LSTGLTADSETLSALREGVEALQLMADYKLPSTLDRRMHELGARKEFLSPDEHAELLALVDLAQGRTVEKLKAMVALKRLRQSAPSLFKSP